MNAASTKSSQAHSCEPCRDVLADRVFHALMRVWDALVDRRVIGVDHRVQFGAVRHKGKQRRAVCRLHHLRESTLKGCPVRGANNGGLPTAPRPRPSAPCAWPSTCSSACRRNMFHRSEQRPRTDLRRCQPKPRGCGCNMNHRRRLLHAGFPLQLVDGRHAVEAGKAQARRQWPDAHRDIRACDSVQNANRTKYDRNPCTSRASVWRSARG